ncbi:hypothetical protein [Zhongshania borealis]
MRLPSPIKHAAPQQVGPVVAITLGNDEILALLRAEKSILEESGYGSSNTDNSNERLDGKGRQ